ncbi:hypothetical protein ACH4OQ_24510 [Streptomyces luteogriseus]|uniref:hypothetical protein n=1 Tax=Streptomyces luteogriseus TaxID=68233 RepID=UPI00379F4A25
MAFFLAEFTAGPILLTLFGQFGYRYLAAVSYLLALTLSTYLLLRIMKGKGRLYLPSHLLLFSATEAVVFTGSLAAMRRGSGGDFAAIEAFLEYFSVGILTSVAWIWLTLALASMASLLQRGASRVRRYDAALTRWVQVTEQVWTNRCKMHNPSVARKCIIGVEKVARSVEGACAPSSLLGFFGQHQKREVADEAVRISEAFRAHKAAILKADQDGDVTRLVESMLLGIEALSSGDREVLLENAPEEITRSDRLRRFLVWVIPPVTLIGAGLLLPLIPAVAANGAAVESLRWSLIVAGVLALIAAQKDVAARINETFGKAMSWK